MDNGFQKNDILANLVNMVDLLEVYENGIEFCELPTKIDVIKKLIYIYIIL